MFRHVNAGALAHGSENNVFHSTANRRIFSLTSKRLCDQLLVSKQTRSSLQMSRDNTAQIARASCRNRCSGCIGRGLVVSKRAHVAPSLSISGYGIKAKGAKSQRWYKRLTAETCLTSCPPIVDSTSSSSCMICDSNLHVRHKSMLMMK
jgi:hypothetical protein